MKIRAYRDADWAQWLRMSLLLFPEQPARVLEEGMREFRGRPDAEDWARRRGYRAMASDAQLSNDVSHAAHRCAGYEEVDRVVQYRRVLDDATPSPPRPSGDT